MTQLNRADTSTKVKSKEFKALGFIIFLLFPILTVTGISVYGFVIWMIQAFGGVVAH
ncbi:trimethylamine N-oxide reductase system protein TorE [Shewanella colwelliana]|uniref:Trimethylamine N-oxide reductase system protein TorE n=1 Tax=Shewanella colwelliana TaxID=23 RepID=A0A1E5IU97_SHECO|nr:trimethylamine N-oxide reductase system protein TorE [Shewanella colwelliana]MCZ4337527.1 trimethylamine N-oxide reductase system protein TorE [Shewanella colwelliana]MDX1281949.1 trimethylamine N-oxide reductase system protein TorE [Shewanella colwelliana]OEG73523.1 trimethylamine N-oxide reductase system protein TorE [Shewanella colwelliana]